MSNAYEQLEAFLRAESFAYEKDYDLSSAIALRIGGNVDFMIPVETEENAAHLYRRLQEYQIPFFVIGEGTNILLSGSGFHGAVIRLEGEFRTFSFDDTTFVSGAAVSMERAAREARLSNLTGLEFACALPGTVGGCVIKNASAFGSSIADVLAHIRVIDHEGTIRVMERDELLVSKTKSNLNGFIVTSATFTLEEGAKDVIDRTTARYRYIRGMLQPNARSSGFVFSDPDHENKAHEMIERVGATNLNYNGARWYRQFPNYILVGNSTRSEDIYALIKDTQKMIFQHYNLHLQMNLMLIGTFDTNE